MNHSLELRLVEFNLQNFLREVENARQSGACNVLVRPINSESKPLLGQLVAGTEGINWCALALECTEPLPDGFSIIDHANEADACVLLFRDADSLSTALLDYIDAPRMIVIAPITVHYFRNRPLFVTTIPKSGTHLLLELLKTFDIKPGGDNVGTLRGSHWYFIATNPHHSAKKYVRDHFNSPRNHRYFDFVEHPAVFMYRNPLDIVVSEANYYARESIAVFHAVYGRLSFEDRMLKAISDPWLVPNLRDRIGAFIPWLDFPNVISISFEELVGEAGSGSELAQTRIIWSLQLKLHIPGNPREYGQACFNTNSPTFHTGRIGSYRKCFTTRIFDEFLALPQDFMGALGYETPRKNETDAAVGSVPVPRHAERLRRRPILFSAYRAGSNPMATEFGYLGYNIVRFQGRHYAVPQDAGDLDLRALPPVDLESLQQDGDLAALKQRIFMQSRAGNSSLVQQPDMPRLVETYRDYQIVHFHARYFAIPAQSELAELAIASEADRAYLLSAPLLTVIKRLVDSPPDPRLIATAAGYNIVAYKGLLFAIPQSLGAMDLRIVDLNNKSGVFSGMACDELLRKISDQSNAR